jgi:hypothetical protein
VWSPIRCLVVIAVVSSFLAVAASCGGGDGPPDLGPEAAAAVKEINAACKEWNALVEARGEFPIRNFDAERPDADDLPAVGDYFAEDHPAREEMIAAIAALDVPGEIEQRHAALVAALERGHETAKEQAAAAQAADVDGFTATLDRADASRQEIDEAADALGASECTA